MGKRIVYDLDHQGSTPKKQLEATPITLYNSEDSYNLGCLIAANKNYVFLSSSLTPSFLFPSLLNIISYMYFEWTRYAMQLEERW